MNGLEPQATLDSGAALSVADEQYLLIVLQNDLGPLITTEVQSAGPLKVKVMFDGRYVDNELQVVKTQQMGNTVILGVISE